MKKLDEIQVKAQEAIDDYADIKKQVGETIDEFELEKGRAELAEEILEIINGVK